jgi:hypothetical protein
MQLASVTGAAPDLCVPDRGHAAVHRNRICDKPSGRPTPAELAEYYASVLRHPDGSIDFDSYRKRAAAIRGNEIRRGAVLGVACASILTLCCLSSLILAIAGARIPAPAFSETKATIVSTQP